MEEEEIEDGSEKELLASFFRDLAEGEESELATGANSSLKKSDSSAKELLLEENRNILREALVPITAIAFRHMIEGPSVREKQISDFKGLASALQILSEDKESIRLIGDALNELHGSALLWEIKAQLCCENYPLLAIKAYDRLAEILTREKDLKAAAMALRDKAYVLVSMLNFEDAKRALSDAKDLLILHEERTKKEDPEGKGEPMEFHITGIDEILREIG